MASKKKKPEPEIERDDDEGDEEMTEADLEGLTPSTMQRLGDTRDWAIQVANDVGEIVHYIAIASKSGASFEVYECHPKPERGKKHGELHHVGRFKTVDAAVDEIEAILQGDEDDDDEDDGDED